MPCLRDGGNTDYITQRSADGVAGRLERLVSYGKGKLLCIKKNLSLK